jgi:formylglycine-generating enzyme required for sulfatase activity
MTFQIKIDYQPNRVRGYLEDLGGVPLEMLLIPPGTFTMGAPASEEESRDSERPPHEVTVSPFFLGRYPITQAQWKFVANLPQEGKELKPDLSYHKGEKRPVEKVSWYDAIEFCARLCRHTRKPYRLPSEAEWEYACRAGTTTPFHFGETISTELANYDGSNEEYGAYGRGIRGEYRRETTDVDHFWGANPFGLSGMHGNVWEWCLDPWHEDYKGAPTDGSVWDKEINDNDNLYQDLLNNINILLANKQRRVLHGGSWSSIPRDCRSAYRYSDGLSDDYSYIGVRVACGLPKTF